jgi:hypothetical protein
MVSELLRVEDLRVAYHTPNGAVSAVEREASLATA